MEMNYQLIVDSVAHMLLMGFPISIILLLTAKIVNILTCMIFGRKVDL